MKPPFITVITSTLNSSKSILSLSNSLKKQNFKNFEWLIVDGGSNDGTLNILKESKDANLICSEKDNGIYYAWNKAIPHIKGKWIVFLGSDDYLIDENVFSDLYFFIKKSKLDNFDIIYGRVSCDKKLEGLEIKDFNKAVSKKMCICHQATFHSRELFLKYRKFNESFLIAGDYEFILRASKSPNFKIKYFSRTISVMGLEGMSTNKINGLRSAKEAYRAREINNIRGFNIYWLKHFLAGNFYFLLDFLTKKSKFIFNKIK